MTPGEIYPDELRAQLDRTTVLLVVMGKDWQAVDTDGLRQLDDPNDWVHREISYGIESEPAVLVIPVLLDGVEPPAEADLSSPLRPLAHRQIARMRDEDWENDFGNLAQVIAAYAGWARSGAETLVFGTPPIVVSNFEDRPEYVNQLGRDDTTVLTAVSGIGGVGKSQLAAHFFGKQQRHYQIACWVDMRNRNGLDNYEAVAEALNLLEPGADAVTELRRAMATSKHRWLMVYDNAENPEQLQPLLVQADNVTNLVTSRYRHWQTYGTTIDVNVFEPAVAARYLLASADRDDDPYTDELAQDLGYLPLALNLAGAYCRNRSLTFTAYRSRLANSLIASLKPTTQEAYDKTVEAIWRESLVAAEQAQPGAKGLAELLCAIDWTSVDRAWFASRSTEPEAVELQLVALASYSLIALRPNRLAVSHNTIADGVLAEADTERLIQSIEALLAQSITTASATMDAAAAAAEPIRHLQHLAVENEYLVSAPILNTLRFASKQLLLQRIPHQELSLASEQAHQRVLGAEHPSTLTAKGNLAGSHALVGRIDDSIDLQLDVVADTTRILGPQHPDTLRAKANLGGFYTEAGRTNDAISLEEQVLENTVSILGPTHPHALDAMNNLAVSYSKARRDNDAILIQKRVLAETTLRLGPEHPKSLISKANLASSYRQLGLTCVATMLEEHVLEDTNRILGPKHGDTLTVKANLAKTYWQANRIDEAITLEEQTLDGRADTLGPRHPTTRTSKASLSKLYIRANRLSDAIRVLEEMLGDDVEVFGQAHPNTLNTKAALAHACLRAGRNNDAIAILDEVLAHSRQLVGPEHINTLNTKASLAGAYWRAGRDNDAIDLLADVLAQAQDIEPTAIDRADVAELLKQASEDPSR